MTLVTLVLWHEPVWTQSEHHTRAILASREGHSNGCPCPCVWECRSLKDTARTLHSDAEDHFRLLVSPNSSRPSSQSSCPRGPYLRPKLASPWLFGFCANIFCTANPVGSCFKILPGRNWWSALSCSSSPYQPWPGSGPVIMPLGHFCLHPQATVPTTLNTLPEKGGLSPTPLLSQSANPTFLSPSRFVSLPSTKCSVFRHGHCQTPAAEQAPRRLSSLSILLTYALPASTRVPGRCWGNTPAEQRRPLWASGSVSTAQPTLTVCFLGLKFSCVISTISCPFRHCRCHFCEVSSIPSCFHLFF